MSYSGNKLNSSLTVKKHLLWAIGIILIQFLPTNAASVRPYLFILVLALPALNHFGISRLTKSKIYDYYYVFTFIASLVLHFYQGSIVSIVSFIAFFIFAPMVVTKNVWDREDFEKLLSIILVLFTIYAVLGIVEAFTRFNVFDFVFHRTTIIEGGANEIRSNLYRGHGVLTVSINNAMLMNMIWMLSNYRLCNQKKKKLFWTLSWCLIGLDVIIILSRAVIFAGIIGQLLMFKKNGARWVTRRVLVGIVLLCLVLPFAANQFEPILNAGKSLFYPIINEVFGAHLVAPGGQTYQGSGNRFQLWLWIYERVKEHFAFGVGFTNAFAYDYTAKVVSGQYAGTAYAATKTSIEVHWLYVLYQKGLFGLSGFVLYQLGCLKKLFSKQIECYESRITFQYTMQVMTVSYFLLLFTCSGFEDLQFFYVMMGLYAAYQGICGSVGRMECK